MRIHETPKCLTDSIQDLLEDGMDYEIKRVDDTTIQFLKGDSLFEVKVINRGLKPVKFAL